MMKNLLILLISAAKTPTFWTAVGALAAVAGVVAVTTGKARIVTEPRSHIAKTEITARVPGSDYRGWHEVEHPPRYDAPQVPAEAATHPLGDILKCDQGYRPAVAWHEITGSWPSIDVMYSVNANVTPDGDIEIALRSRQGFEHGYAYIDVIVQCELR